MTAASLFDGHDAAINIMRRILQAQGAEVIHLGHDRSVDEVVRAVIQEDVQGVAISSYQGGHLEYFRYLVDRLAEAGRPDARVYGGGGGVIVPAEIEALQAYGVARIFTPEDGAALGLAAMVNTMVAACDVDLAAGPLPSLDALRAAGDPQATRPETALARTITALEAGRVPADRLAELHALATEPGGPGAGHHRHRRVGQVVAHRRAGAPRPPRHRRRAADHRARRRPHPAAGRRGAAGRPHPHERHRPPGITFRSLATRGDGVVPEALDDIVAAAKVAGADLVIVETPGIGQGDAAIVDHADVALYVMTPEFGAASQLEKIDMLDFADVVAINKFDRRGAEDALRDVRKQMARNSGAFGVAPEEIPAFGTVASRFNDDGVTALYQELRTRLAAKGLRGGDRGAEATGLAPVDVRSSTLAAAIVPPARVRYLAEVAEAVRAHHRRVEARSAAARARQQVRAVRAMLPAGGARRRRRPRPPRGRGRRAARRRVAGAARRLAGDRRGLPGRRAHRPGARHRHHDPADRRVALGHPHPPRRPAPHRGRRRAAAVPAAGEPAGPLPVHRRRVRLPARQRAARPACSPARATRSAPTGASACWPRASRPPGCRRPSTR